MKINYIEKTEILDFEKQIDCELVVEEVESFENDTYKTKCFAGFKRKDTGYFIGSEIGNGETVDKAIIDYCDKISKKIINRLNENGSLKDKIYIPSLKHTRLVDTEKQREQDPEYTHIVKVSDYFCEYEFTFNKSSLCVQDYISAIEDALKIKHVSWKIIKL